MDSEDCIDLIYNAFNIKLLPKYKYICDRPYVNAKMYKLPLYLIMIKKII